MSLTVRQHITRKAALVKHHGADDPRVLAADSDLRVARVLAAIQALAEAEREELTRLLSLNA